MKKSKWKVVPRKSKKSKIMDKLLIFMLILLIIVLEAELGRVDFAIIWGILEIESLISLVVSVFEKEK